MRGCRVCLYGQPPEVVDAIDIGVLSHAVETVLDHEPRGIVLSGLRQCEQDFAVHSLERSLEREDAIRFANDLPS